jgi:hypothetical protein
MSNRKTNVYILVGFVVLLKHPLSFSPLVPTVVFAAIIQFTTLLVSSDCSFLLKSFKTI